MIWIVTFAVLAVLSGGWLLFRHGGPTWEVCALFAVLLVSVAGTGIAALGFARPSFVCRAGDEAQVVSYVLDEPSAIYLWLLPVDQAAPVACVFSWSKKTASSLVSQAADAAANGRGLMMGQGNGKPHDGSLDDEGPMFYPAPQAPLPLKPGEGQ